MSSTPNRYKKLLAIIQIEPIRCYGRQHLHNLLLAQVKMRSLWLRGTSSGIWPSQLSTCIVLICTNDLPPLEEGPSVVSIIMFANLSGEPLRVAIQNDEDKESGVIWYQHHEVQQHYVLHSKIKYHHYYHLHMLRAKLVLGRRRFQIRKFLDSTSNHSSSIANQLTVSTCIL